MAPIAPDTPLDAYYTAVPLEDKGRYVESLRTRIYDIVRSDPNEAELKKELDGLEYNGMQAIDPPEPDDEDLRNFVLLKWRPEQDIAHIHVRECPEFERTRLQEQISVLRQEASEVRARKRPKAIAASPIDTPPSAALTASTSPTLSPAPDSDNVPSLSSNTSTSNRSSKLEGVRYCDRALVITWSNEGQEWRNMMAVEEWKLATASKKSLGTLPGCDTGYYAPDKCQIGHAQGLIYLVSANEMGGTFLLRIIIGTKFRRAVILPGKIIVVEDNDPTRDPDLGPGRPGEPSDPDRTPTKGRPHGSTPLASQQSEISVKAFIHDAAIESRMPWDLADVRASHRPYHANVPPSALVYADFMYRAVKLATDRDIEHAAARRLPDPTKEQCLSYVDIVSSAHKKIHADDEQTRDLLLYARWKKFSTLVNDEKLRRPRTVTPSAHTASASAGPRDPFTDSPSPATATTLPADDTEAEPKASKNDDKKGTARTKRRVSPPPATVPQARPKRDEDDDGAGSGQAGGPSAGSGRGSRGQASSVGAQGRTEGRTSTAAGSGSATSAGAGSRTAAATGVYRAGGATVAHDWPASAEEDRHEGGERFHPQWVGRLWPGPGDTDRRKSRNAAAGCPEPQCPHRVLDAAPPASTTPPFDQASASYWDPTPSPPSRELVPQRLDAFRAVRPFSDRAAKMDHLASWLSTSASPNSLDDLSEGAVIWTGLDDLEVDAQASSMTTSSDEESRGKSLPQGQLIDLLEAAGVRIWRTSPFALSDLITKMVDDNIRNTQLTLSLRDTATRGPSS